HAGVAFRVDLVPVRDVDIGPFLAQELLKLLAGHAASGEAVDQKHERAVLVRLFDGVVQRLVSGSRKRRRQHQTDRDGDTDPGAQPAVHVCGSLSSLTSAVTGPFPLTLFGLSPSCSSRPRLPPHRPPRPLPPPPRNRQSPTVCRRSCFPCSSDCFPTCRRV